ncbi:MAG: hypothetical protein HZC16_00205 [Candidatus Omnitrophica bacterium]|nr:hypothetical protein [Candidatus Omnitrophota bacterium]
MEDIESRAKHFLESWGFSVEKIPESKRHGKKTPDFLVTDETSVYIVEVKTREDDPAETLRLNQTLKDGKLFEAALPLVRNKTVSDKVRYASKQLANNKDGNAFKLVWLIATGRLQEAKSRQLEATLYGTTGMFDLDSGEGVHRPCYFFRHSDFFRFRYVLDAAIVSTLTSGKLCINTLSPRYNSFKQTRLYAHFGSAICDPAVEEALGGAYIVDSDVNRGDENAVMAYIRSKYGCPKLINVDIGCISATVGYSDAT